jgi:membrane protease YdiL (CAAX protease family)
MAARSMSATGLPDARPSTVTWIGVAALLTLRLPYLTGLPLLLGGEPAWLDPSFQVATYATIAFLIWWERKSLPASNIDGLAITIIVLFKPVQTVILTVWGGTGFMSFPQPGSLAVLAIAIALAAAMWRARPAGTAFSWRSLGWLGAGCVLGAVLTVGVSVLMIAFLKNPVPPNPGSMALLAPFYQLGYAAVDEEPLFRAFLWGVLLRSGWRNGWIWLLQAALFTAGHLHLLNTPQAAVNLLIVFGFALAAGGLAWRSKGIAASLGLHAFWNGSPLIVYAVTAAIFK